MPKILIVDSYYPEFLCSVGIGTSYDRSLRLLMGQSFGTADFYSRHLAMLGWDTVDVIANADFQYQWAREKMVDGSLPEVLLHQIQWHQPDVLFFQDLSLMAPDVLGGLHQKYLLAGQCSCPMPQESQIRQFHVLFTSFPHYVSRFEAYGVKAVYNPLAFDPVVLERLNRIYQFGPKAFDCVFIGGVGAPSHWKYGMQVLETVAQKVPEAWFFGYGYDRLDRNSPVRAKYIGEAWGLRQYEILCRSRMAINRHGEVAENYANNMKLFEITGAGALLITDMKENLEDFFEIGHECAVYSDPDDAVSCIRYFQRNPEEAAQLAKRGQQRTLRDHTYEKRMKTVSDTLKGML